METFEVESCARGHHVSTFHTCIQLARICAHGCYVLHHAREFNLAIFYDSPNRQIKVLTNFSGYTVTWGTHKVNLECEERVESRVQITCTVFMMVKIGNNN